MYVNFDNENYFFYINYMYYHALLTLLLVSKITSIANSIITYFNRRWYSKDASRAPKKSLKHR